ncbi:MAG: hypothetical protein NT076_02340 [Candidatus Pacearchaeota archaeon]|nr:hypothetical protein [Candidatus Pacearchaeota archaeon]
MELWNEIITEKSQNLVFELKRISNFVLIGGWAIWLYSRALKSKDIDIYINFDDFFKLQNFFAERSITINFNQKLNKYEAKVGEIDIDICTPHHCNLRISCKEVFEKNLFKNVEGFKVVIPEILLLLKIDAEEKRHETIKGFKDRVDILSLLYKISLDKDLLNKLSNEYKIDIKRLKEIILKSSKEYSYFFPEAENFAKLKKFKMELLKKCA